jgi:hypothetical protein
MGIIPFELVLSRGHASVASNASAQKLTSSQLFTCPSPSKMRGLHLQPNNPRSFHLKELLSMRFISERSTTVPF